MIINKGSKIITSLTTLPILNAIKTLKGDIDKILTSTDTSTDIHLVSGDVEKEMFIIQGTERCLEIVASDELGFIYGIYEVSKQFLGISEFWFWNNQQFTKKDCVEIEDNFFYKSTPFKVNLRGWFINDEVLLHTWTLEQSSIKPWEMAFETLLRCNGNMVIPGTGKNSEIYRSTASSMGLFISHHHAEPLGAKMFSNVYPDLNPSYDEHTEKFQQVWVDGIKEQSDCKVVWNLGFRGQGDCPFWANDPKYDTSEKRGKLISELIKLQYDLVKKYRPQDACCTNLYGEVLELYRENCLELPSDIIKIWGDNGFGKMVSRRQNNHNPRIPALASKDDTSKQGVYYHASFYDLQAANHITLLPNKPSFIIDELKTIFEHGMNEYWIINCSNIKPHVFYLDLISKVWRSGSVSADKFIKAYVLEYYGEENHSSIVDCYNQYFDSALSFGSHQDEKAGEQFPNYTSRILVSQFLRDRNTKANSLNWALDSTTLKEQIIWYKNLCETVMSRYSRSLMIHVQWLEQVNNTRAMVGAGR